MSRLLRYLHENLSHRFGSSITNWKFKIFWCDQTWILSANVSSCRSLISCTWWRRRNVSIMFIINPEISIWVIQSEICINQDFDASWSKIAIYVNIAFEVDLKDGRNCMFRIDVHRLAIWEKLLVMLNLRNASSSVNSSWLRFVQIHSTSDGTLTTKLNWNAHSLWPIFRC